ncbi:MAG: hypothetical protein ACYDAK_01535 [Candidatus Limnocylindrales bacterium]
MIGLLVRLYPARWRARYGHEFEALLDERRLGPFDVADVLLGAIDAHLRRGGVASASNDRKGLLDVNPSRWRRCDGRRAPLVRRPRNGVRAG